MKNYISLSASTCSSITAVCDDCVNRNEKFSKQNKIFLKKNKKILRNYEECMENNILVKKALKNGIYCI